MNNFLKILFIAAIFFCASCKKNTDQAARSFYMGVTPWPADFTVEEVNAAYSFINNHCDMVSHHFDEGIPYEEAYSNSNWPPGLLADINGRKINTAAGKKILVSSSALSLTRKEKAPYSSHAVNTAASVKNYWQQLPFNDEKVITAYTNFLSLLVDNLQPAFINYGVKSNVDIWDAASFIQYKDFLRQVYSRLKTNYPGIPIMVSFIVNETTSSFDYARQLLPFTDYIALSAYPYTNISSSAGVDTNPALFPDNYFNRVINLDKSKPLCFAETAYIAEPLAIPAFNVNKQGNKAWQQAYLEKICQLLNDKKGKFLVWFCHKDYDAAVKRLIATGQYQDLFGLWQNTGLLSETNAQRPAYNSWLNWMAREKK